MDFATGVLRVRHAGRLDPAAARLPEGMRSSIMLIPALLARLGEARIEGDVKGCTLGVREIDPHIEVFQTFGVEVTPERGALALSNRPRNGRAVRRRQPLARLRLGDHHRELRALRRHRRRDLDADQRGLRAARAGVLRVPHQDGREDRGRRREPPGGRGRRAAARRRARLRRGLPRDRHLPGAGRDHRRRGADQERPPRPVPADRPHLRQVRRRGHPPGRLVVAPAPTGR